MPSARAMPCPSPTAAGETAWRAHGNPDRSRATLSVGSKGKCHGDDPQKYRDERLHWFHGLRLREQ